MKKLVKLYNYIKIAKNSSFNFNFCKSKTFFSFSFLDMQFAVFLDQKTVIYDAFKILSTTINKKTTLQSKSFALQEGNV